MKTKLFITAICIGWALDAFSQCSVSLQVTHVTCCGICNGVITATPTGGIAPYTYAWSNGGTAQTVSGLCQGSYTCVVTDALSISCMNSDTVGCPLTLSPSVADASCSTCCDGAATATASGGNPPYTYSWAGTGCSMGNSAVCSTSHGCTAICPGTYTVCVTDASSNVLCTSYTVNFTTGQNEIQSNASISIYPNPFREFTFLAMESDQALYNASLFIYDVFGKEVKRQKNINWSQIVIWRDQLPTGMYFYKLLENDYEVTSGKFVIVD